MARHHRPSGTAPSEPIARALTAGQPSGRHRRLRPATEPAPAQTEVELAELLAGPAAPEWTGQPA